MGRTRAKMVLPLGPLSAYRSHKEEIDDAIARVVSGGRYVLGEEVAAFEQEFAAYIGVAFGVGVGSGTDALHIALRACKIGPGDEVITVAHTAVATVAAIELSGARPIFVDVDPGSFTMDPNQLPAAITPKTRAIVPVHLYGHPGDVSNIVAVANDHDLYLIEDCAQSHGAMYNGRKTGAWGHMGAFSFYPTKNLGAMGDGGMVVTDDPELADRVRMLRQYGWRERDFSVTPGLNTRLDEIQAALLRVKLRHLDDDNNHRRKLAQVYDTVLSSSNLTLPTEGPDARHVYHQYVIRTQGRNALKSYLEERGIDTQVHYPTPVHLQPAYLGRVGHGGLLPITETLCHDILSLPIHQHLTEQHVQSVGESVKEWSEIND